MTKWTPFANPRLPSPSDKDVDAQWTPVWASPGMTIEFVLGVFVCSIRMAQFSLRRSGHLESLGHLYPRRSKPGPAVTHGVMTPCAAPEALEVPRPPSDASRRPIDAGCKPAAADLPKESERALRSDCRRPSVDRFPIRSGEIDHLFDPRSRACRRPGLLVALGLLP